MIRRVSFDRSEGQFFAKILKTLIEQLEKNLVKQRILSVGDGFDVKKRTCQILGG
jgi:hypothetical protein